MLNPSEFASVDELSDDAFFLAFGDEGDINAVNAEFHDPDIWNEEDVPF